jgi:acetylornithine deacetylase/succinyl-diaminopimelate desuccinylase-like protein
MDLSAVEIAEELIRFDTSGPPARERPLAKWIRDFLEDAGFNAELQEVAPGRANVVAKIGEGSGPGLVSPATWTWSWRESPASGQ